MSYYCICKKINQRTNLVNGTDYTWTRYDANGSALADYSNGASYWDIGGRERSFHGGAEITGSSPQTGTPSYYLRNHLGSIMATTNASKDIVASYQYTPYGEFLSESTSGDHATFGYTGHRLDRELNHYYAKYRYYNPTTLRWLSRDPLGMVDGPNVYAYVRGNVVHAVDPDGLTCTMLVFPNGAMSGCLEQYRWWKKSGLIQCNEEYQKDQLKCFKDIEDTCPEPQFMPWDVPPHIVAQQTKLWQEQFADYKLRSSVTPTHIGSRVGLPGPLAKCLIEAYADYLNCAMDKLGL